MARKISNYRLHIRDSDWLNFILFSGYKYKIKFILRKREDKALISISTILKFPVQKIYFNKYKNDVCHITIDCGEFFHFS